MPSAITELLFDTTELLLVRVFLTEKIPNKTICIFSSLFSWESITDELDFLTLEKKWNTLSCLILM